MQHVAAVHESIYSSLEAHTLIPNLGFVIKREVLLLRAFVDVVVSCCSVVRRWRDCFPTAVAY